jgi:predicted helicase
MVFGVKNNTKTASLADVYKSDFYGLRNEKFAKLDAENMGTISWIKLPIETELWVLQGEGKPQYERGFSIPEMFTINSAGVVTGKDKVLINDNKNDLMKHVADFYKIEPNQNFIQKINYRIFDSKFIYFDAKLIARPREKVMKHFLNKENIGIDFHRGLPPFPGSEPIFIVKELTDREFSHHDYIAPLYLYTDQDEKVPNLNKEIWDKINEIVGNTTPENILDYIYAVLHSPVYREKYNEFLKIDFPRVPYPESKEKFFALAKLGEKLRGLHLMTDSSVSNFITTFPNVGSDEVEKISYKEESVFINTDQYFGNVPEIAWNFYIGGYQPAQKYLKDRKGRKLTNDEIEQYQRIIKVLTETDKIMREIDTI